MLLSTLVCYSQMTVQSSFINNTNKLTSQFTFPPGVDVSQDLFFSIGPNGLPQYGQSVDWNLSIPTEGKLRSYHVIKGDWDRSAIRTHEEDINFIRSTNVYPVANNPNIDMGTNWIKLGQSWNFTYDNYTLAIVSFTNQDITNLNEGTVTFSHPKNEFIAVPEIIIYNDWASLLNTREVSGNMVYTFEYKDLSPGEIRHLYLKVDISENTTLNPPAIDLFAEMTNFQSDELTDSGTIPPHDPNALTLLTAIENTTRLQDCNSYLQYPDLVEACKKRELFWINHANERDEKCPFQYSLNYPYSNYDSESLTYSITCFNDGAGEARHVALQCDFDLKTSPFEEQIFEYSGSHDVDGSFNYPTAKFEFKEINLPGLGNRRTVYTYDECSAEVTFTIKTQCNLNKIIDANAFITFFDSKERSVGDVHTNNLMIVPEQGRYTNYKPEPIPCGYNEREPEDCTSLQKILMQWNNTELNLIFERNSIEDQVNFKLFDISGRLLEERNINPNGSIQVQEQIETSRFSSGIYVLSIQSGNENYVEKFIRP